MKDKYSIVAAAPIIDHRDRYVGCITADTPQGASSHAMSRAVIQASLATTAQLVGEALDA